MALLEVKNLSISFGGLKAVDNFQISIEKGQLYGLIGPNGAGKSTVMGMISRLIAHDSGVVDFEGRDIGKWKSRELSRRLAILTQSNSIQMKLTVRELVTFGRFPYSGNRVTLEDQKIIDRAISYMELEGFQDRFIDELSGGQRQRAMIAMAMSCSPKVLIADEPTTALDVTIQAQIFELMEKLKREHDTAIMLITHDMGVVSELADDVAVMYMGSIVERGSVREVLKYPAHPYTAALLRSIPILHKGRGQRLEPIRGSTPDPYDRPKGCQFAPRCDFCCEKCRQEMPSEVPVCDGHAVRCWNAEQVYAGHREEVEAV